MRWMNPTQTVYCPKQTLRAAQTRALKSIPDCRVCSSSFLKCSWHLPCFDPVPGTSDKVTTSVMGLCQPEISICYRPKLWRTTCINLPEVLAISGTSGAMYQLPRGWRSEVVQHLSLPCELQVLDFPWKFLCLQCAGVSRDLSALSLGVRLHCDWSAAS